MPWAPGGKRLSIRSGSGPPRAWTEAVTLITNGHVPDAVYEEVRQHLSEEDLVNLTLAVVAINGWNRFAISFRTVPGTYQPAHR